jgi:predicted ATPase/predicted Ser/Thr protein kinase
MGSGLLGRTLAHYTVVRKLGSGGMGDVYLAHDTVLDRSVALKVLPSRTTLMRDQLRRFVAEAKAASALNHPHIATVHELRSAGGIHFIVMEYVEGETLKAKVARGPLDPTAIIKVATQIAGALEVAHSAGIVHRDIKSSNIVITPRGHAKVLDFGLAKRMTSAETLSRDPTEATEAGVVMGTLSYMSPEQAFGRPLDHRSDLFSLGVVLYEMATGRLPFCGATTYETIDQIIHHDPTPIRSINPSLPAGLERLIVRCLAKKPEDRVQSAAEFANDLRASEMVPAIPERRRSSGNNLPQQLTRFIGRQREIVEIRQSLTRTRLLTLSGPGGIGKTRLALQVAASSLQEYDDGVWFVEFASLIDPGLVPHTVAATLGVSEERGRSITDTVVDYLKGRRLLLVLDNCEHLITACAQLTDTVLRSSPDVRVLATSRESLAISGETVFRVPSLGVPDPERPADVENLGAHEAVELFVDRARAVKSTFAVTGATAAPLARLCARLEGIPLAIELAASRVKVLSMEQIADRLDDRLNLLTGGSRTALPRHQTLLGAIDWSYNLLTELEKDLFRRLSVFAGGWTLEAAERVCSGEGVDESGVLELLSGLVDKSLVLTEDRDGQQRYRLMVTLLEYAHKRLVQTDEGDAISRRYAEFFATVAAEGEPNLIGAEQKLWLERLNAEYDNLRAVLNWASKHDVAMALRLAGALGRFWYLRGYLDEGRKWLEEILAAQGADVHPANRVKALNAAARIAQNQGDYVSARSFSEQALGESRQAGDKRETAGALAQLAILEALKGGFAATRSLLEESLAIWRELGDKAGIAIILNNLGAVGFQQGEFVLAQRFTEEALGLASEVGDKHGMAVAMVNRAEVARRLGDHARAQSLLEHGLAIAKDIGDQAVIPVALNSLGDLAERQGNYAAARDQLEEALKLARELGDKRVIAGTLVSLGVVAERCGEYVAAQSILEESVIIHRELDERVEIALGLNCLGRVTARRGDRAAARSHHEEALAICRQAGARDGIAQSLNGLADVARLQGDHSLALSLYKQSVALWWELGEKPELPPPLEHIGTMIAARGRHEQAARLWGAAEALRTTIGVARPPSETDEYQRHISASRAALGEEAFAAAWAQGQVIDPDRAVAHALEESGQGSLPI